MATIPGTNVPTTVTGTGVISRPNGVAARHLFDGGIEKPAILKTLLEKFPNFYLTSLLDKIESASFNGSDKGVQSQKPWAWNIMGRTRRSATASSISDGTTASATVITDIAHTSANAAGYWLVGAPIYIPNSGARARVDAVGDSGGSHTITYPRSSAAVLTSPGQCSTTLFGWTTTPTTTSRRTSNIANFCVTSRRPSSLVAVSRPLLPLVSTPLVGCWSMRKGLVNS